MFTVYEGASMSVKESVQRQFGQVAANYASSSVHVGGPDLSAMLAAARLQGGERVLDAGAGAGHTALAFAAAGAEVTALDLTEAMLEQGRQLAQQRGLATITFQQGDVEQIEQPDHSFDLVTSRYSAHHYPHPHAALREFARVLRPHGRLLLVDVVAPPAPAADTFLNAIELLRDTSHVRDHSIVQWLAMLEAAGLQGEVLGEWPLRLEFASWVARMHTPEASVALIRSLQSGAPAEVSATLAIESDGSFCVPVALLAATRPAR
jgi:ubiquinone/menaquinone biosynthesis C-methylase UbiE